MSPRSQADSVCRCTSLEKKVKQHEEVIAQLLQMMAILNNTVTRLNDKAKKTESAAPYLSSH